MSRRFAVIFGRKQSDAAILQRLDAWRQGRNPAGVRVFDAATTTPPLRFNSDDRVRFPPSFLAEIPDTAARVARLKSEVSRDLDVFAKNPRRLLDLYFDFIAARLVAERAALDHLLRPLGGLFRVEDWVYSALRPLPNAALFDADDPESSAAPVPHDLMFWTGRAVLAIRLRGSGTQSSREADATESLRAMGVQVLTIPAEELGTGTELFSAVRFPPEFWSFWQGAPFPCSPFRPQGLPEALRC